MVIDYGRDMTADGLNSTDLSTLLLGKLRQEDGKFIELLSYGVNSRSAWAWTVGSISTVSLLASVDVYSLVFLLLGNITSLLDQGSALTFSCLFKGQVFKYIHTIG